VQYLDETVDYSADVQAMTAWDNNIDNLEIFKLKELALCGAAIWCYKDFVHSL
jgi:hypothetical protein